jgi:CRP-like cAMP-binding protein
MPFLPPFPPANRLIARLPAAEYQRLSPHLRPVSLFAKQVLYKARATIDYVYFPCGGIVSAMTIMEDGSAIEVATIGKEGVVGLTAFMGGESSPHEVMVQVAGEGLRMPADVFARESLRDGPFRQTLVRYNTAFNVQVAYAVACNGLHRLEKRCCRWLLMTQDRMGGDALPLTHELLAIMLGVRRASVTVVLQPLEDGGLIRKQRGSVVILDRAGLEAASCECYRYVNAEFERLLG